MFIKNFKGMGFSEYYEGMRLLNFFLSISYNMNNFGLKICLFGEPPVLKLQVILTFHLQAKQRIRGIICKENGETFFYYFSCKSFFSSITFYF